MERMQFGGNQGSHNRYLSKHYTTGSSRSSSPGPTSPKDNSCPFAPSLPSTGSYRHAGRVAQPCLASDLTELRAALTGAGIAVEQQKHRCQPCSSSSLQPLQQKPVATGLARGGITNSEYSKLQAELQERTARISSLAGKHDWIDAQRCGRPSRTQSNATAASSRPGSSLDMNLADSAAAATAIPSSCIGRPSSISAHAGLKSKGASTAELLPTLQAQLAAFGGSLSKFAVASNTTGPSSLASSAATAAVFSSQSSTEQPLTPAVSHAPTPQRSGLLAISASTASSRMAAEAGLGTSLSTSSLQSQQLQPTEHLTVAQQLAQAGLAQLQEVTQMGQQLRPVVASISGATADAHQKLQELNAFFKQHPQYSNAPALRQLVAENKQLADANKQLKQELFSKNQLLNSALAKVREQNHTPIDKKTGALRDEVQMLTQQLRARDAALAAAEEDNRRLRDELGLPHRSSDSDLSPVKAEGELYGSTSSPASAFANSPNVSRQLWGDEVDVHSSTCSIASSAMPSRGAGQGPADAAKKLAEKYQAALAAKEQELQQLQLQVEELKAAQQHTVLQPQRAASPLDVQEITRQLSKFNKPKNLADALQQLQATKDMVVTLQQQLLDQDQQACSRAAEREKAFQRQLQVEKTQLQHERQQGKLLTEQIQPLQEQLVASRQQQSVLQQQLDRAEQELQAAVAAASSSRGSSAVLQLEHINQLQRRMQEQKDALINMQEAMQGLYNRINAAGRLVGSPLPAGQKGALLKQLEASIQQLLQDVTSQPSQAKQLEQMQRLQQKLSAVQQQNQQLQEQAIAVEDRNAEYERQVRTAQQQLEACEERLLDFQKFANEKVQLKREVRQLQQSLNDARSELDKALEGQHATAQHLEQCRQQLAEAAADKAVLYDRIRELADRAASAAVSGRSSAASPDGFSIEVQHKLQAACAELNQRVAQLQKQLEESHAKEERLHLVNAQLQERISALQLTKPMNADQDALQQHAQQQAHQIQELQVQLQQEQHNVQELHMQLERQQQLGHQQVTLQQSQAAQQLQEQLRVAQQQLERQQLHAQGLQQQLDETCQAVQHLQEQLQLSQQRVAEQEQQQHDSADSSQQELQQLREELEDRTKELQDWQIHADALEKDLVDLKERADAADELQEQLKQTQQLLTRQEAEVQSLQHELAQCRERVGHLEFDLHDAAKDHSALLSRFDSVTAELARVKEGAADMRLRLEHFTGPAGPQARIRQLEGSLQSLQRRHDAAESRASAAAAQVEELATKLGNAEDEILALEGQVSILEQELAKYTQ